jgi:hypothetical protein
MLTNNLLGKQLAKAPLYDTCLILPLGHNATKWIDDIFPCL